MDLRQAPVGYTCVTSAGATFERVQKDWFGESWRGPDALIWGDRVGTLEYPYADASDICQNFRGRLPTTRDFNRCFRYGCLEVLPHFESMLYYWTSLQPNGTAMIYDTRFRQYYYQDLARGASVRCVGL